MLLVLAWWDGLDQELAGFNEAQLRRKFVSVARARVRETGQEKLETKISQLWMAESMKSGALPQDPWVKLLRDVLIQGADASRVKGGKLAALPARIGRVAALGPSWPDALTFAFEALFDDSPAALERALQADDGRLLELLHELRPPAPEDHGESARPLPEPVLLPTLQAWSEARARWKDRPGRVAQVMDGIADRQWLVLVGPEGQGKTQLALEVLAKWPANGPAGQAPWLPGGVLVLGRQVHGPRSFHDVVMAQCRSRCANLAVPEGQASDAELPQRLYAGLRQLAAEAQGPLLWVVDDWDHLAQRQVGLDTLPMLPPGVSGLMTSRPGDALLPLLRLPFVKVLDVAPADRAELPVLTGLDEREPGVAAWHDRLFAESDGWMWPIGQAMQRLAGVDGDHRRVDAAARPRELFAAQVEQWLGGEEQELMWDVLGALALHQPAGPLALDSLVDWLVDRGHSVRKATLGRRLRLTVGDQLTGLDVGHVELALSRLAEHVASEVLAPREADELVSSLVCVLVGHHADSPSTSQAVRALWEANSKAVLEGIDLAAERFEIGCLSDLAAALCAPVMNHLPASDYPPAAIHALEVATARGDLDADRMLAIARIHGDGIEADPVAGVARLRQLAEADDLDALYTLATLALWDQAVGDDDLEDDEFDEEEPREERVPLGLGDLDAEALLTRAIEGGHARSAYTVGAWMMAAAFEEDTSEAIEKSLLEVIEVFEGIPREADPHLQAAAFVCLARMQPEMPEEQRVRGAADLMDLARTEGQGPLLAAAAALELRDSKAMDDPSFREGLDLANLAYADFVTEQALTLSTARVDASRLDFEEVVQLLRPSVEGRIDLRTAGALHLAFLLLSQPDLEGSDRDLVADILRAYARGQEPMAMYVLGSRLMDGTLEPMEPGEASHWLEQAADAHNPWAMLELAVAQVLGSDGVEKDPIEGWANLSVLVAWEIPRAMEVLAELTLDGHLEPDDPPDDPLSLLERAMEAGSVEAFVILGRRLLEGEGVPKDAARGEELLGRARELGSEEAGRLLEEWGHAIGNYNL